DAGNGAALGPLPGPAAPLAQAAPAGGIVPLDHTTPVSGTGPAPAVIDAPKVVESAKDSIYTVGAGDSLWKIAHKHYGSGDEQAHVDAILAANPTLSSNEYLKVGQKITLPVITAKVDPTRLPAEKQAAETGGRIYVVKEGDTLSAIAKKELGSSKRSNEIFELNRTRLSDP